MNFNSSPPFRPSLARQLRFPHLETTPYAPMCRGAFALKNRVQAPAGSTHPSLNTPRGASVAADGRGERWREESAAHTDRKKTLLAVKLLIGQEEDVSENFRLHRLIFTDFWGMAE